MAFLNSFQAREPAAGMWPHAVTYSGALEQRRATCPTNLYLNHPVILVAGPLALSAAISIGPTENSPALAFSVSTRR